MIFPKLNPLHQINYHGNLSLTPAQKNQNCIAKENNEAILFDPLITSKNTLADCFRIFTDAERISRNPARCQILDGSNRRHDPIVIYTDGACYNNGKQNARCRGGIWFGPNDPRNCTIHIPGNLQSNQVGELTATISAIEIMPPFVLLTIMTDSCYVINGLTVYLPLWEDLGWINIKNAPLFKKADYLLK